MDRDTLPEIPQPTAILFDWDNTLVENWLTVQAAFNAALGAFGRPPMDIEQIRFQARHSSRDVFPIVFGEDWEAARIIFYRHFEDRHLGGLRVMAGAEALLDLCAEMRLPLGVVSNKRGDILRREIAHLGWSERFQSVVGAQDAVLDKPDPAPVHLALSRLGRNAAADVWLVGDTDIDMRAAAAANCTPILVGQGPEERSLPDCVEPVLRCHNCNHLIDFIRSLGTTISRS
jgi:phosphoglycolate phosphatase